MEMNVIHAVWQNCCLKLELPDSVWHIRTS